MVHRIDTPVSTMPNETDSHTNQIVYSLTRAETVWLYDSSNLDRVRVNMTPMYNYDSSFCQEEE